MAPYVLVARALIRRRATAAAIAKLVVRYIALVVQADIVQSLFHVLLVVDGMAQAFLLSARFTATRALRVGWGASGRCVSLGVHDVPSFVATRTQCARGAVRERSSTQVQRDQARLFVEGCTFSPNPCVHNTRANTLAEWPDADIS
jgi:hypothetical protein